MAEQIRIWIERRERKRDAPRTRSYNRSDLKQHKPYGIALGHVVPCPLQTTAPQTLKQCVGKGGEVHPQLVRGNPVGRDAAGEELELLGLYPVLHLSPGAVEVLIKSLRTVLIITEGRHEEPGIGSSPEMFGLAHRSALPGPALLCSEHEALESPRGLPREFVLNPCPAHLFLYPSLQPRGLPHPKHVINPVVIAPLYELFPAEPRVSSQYYPGVFPPPPDLPDNTTDLIRGFRRGILVRGAQPTPKEVPSAEYVPWSVAVASVISVIRPS